MSFDIAYSRSMKLEDPFTEGAKIKYGIPVNVWVKFNDGKPPYSIQNITVHDSKRVCRFIYWLNPKLNLIDETMPNLAMHMFDACLKHGSENAIKFLQQACNFLGSDIKVTGEINAETLTQTRLYERSESVIIAAYIFMRAKKIESMAENQTQKKTIKKLMKRLV
jgi:lysozyme family protein